MKKRTEDILAWIIVILVVSVFVIGLSYFFMKPVINHQKVCSEKLGIPYNIWSGSVPRMYYRYIGGGHYNCCYDKIFLNEEGYYKGKICKGFIKKGRNKFGG